jgi:hypothetical protein
MKIRVTKSRYWYKEGEIWTVIGGCREYFNVAHPANADGDIKTILIGDALIVNEILQDIVITPAKPTNDPVNHPSHYKTGGIECIDAIGSATEDLRGAEAFYVGNAIKYLWRWKKKNGVEDLKKAEWYLQRLIKQQEGE